MDKDTILLQPSEWIIMEKLWEHNPQTIMQLYHELKLTPGWSKSTVNTLLGRMVKKNIISYNEGVKAKQYYPLIDRTQVAIAETEKLIDKIYNGSVSLMMSTLIKNKNLTNDNIKELYKILGEEIDKND